MKRRIGTAPALLFGVGMIIACSSGPTSTPPEEGGAPDGGPPDTGAPIEMGARDAGADATGAPDSGTADTGAPDAGTPDTGAPDAGTPDTGTPDTGAPDSGAPDSGTPDTGAPDAGQSDAGACTLGATQSCYTGPSGTQGVGPCTAGTQTCMGSDAASAAWGPCNGEVLPFTGPPDSAHPCNGTNYWCDPNGVKPAHCTQCVSTDPAQPCGGAACEQSLACQADGTYPQCTLPSTCTCSGTQPVPCTAGPYSCPGTQACVGDQLGTCTATGTCECTNGSTRCVGNGVETCQNNQWGAAVACNGQTCVTSSSGSGSCQGICAPGQQGSCAEELAYTSCNASGQWNTTNCAAQNQTCVAGACQGVCTWRNTQGCSSGVEGCSGTETCQNDGSWGTCSPTGCTPFALPSSPAPGFFCGNDSLQHSCAQSYAFTCPTGTVPSGTCDWSCPGGCCDPANNCEGTSTTPTVTISGSSGTCSFTMTVGGSNYEYVEVTPYCVGP